MAGYSFCNFKMGCAMMGGMKGRYLAAPKPIHLRSSLIRKGRFRIHSGKLRPGYDVIRAVEDDREQRLRKFAGQRGAPYRNAMVLTPEMSNRLRHRRFLQATLSSSRTM